MKPTKFEGQTGVLGSPPDWDENRFGPCKGLPVGLYNGVLYYQWSLSWRERLLLILGKPVWLSVVGHNMAPVSLGVGRLRVCKDCQSDANNG